LFEQRARGNEGGGLQGQAFSYALGEENTTLLCLWSELTGKRYMLSSYANPSYSRGARVRAGCTTQDVEHLRRG